MCPGKDPKAECVVSCSGQGMGIAIVTLTTLRSERLVVELRTGPQGSTHAQTSLVLALPKMASADGEVQESNGWQFSSGLAEGNGNQTGPYVGYFESVRDLYNATVQVYDGGGGV